MKIIKKLSAVMMSLAILLSFAGCHKQGEIAVTVGDWEFTSAYYMCALMNADGEARTKVDEALAEESDGEEETESEDEEETDYYSEKIDDKDFVDWVKDTAIENLEKIAAYKTLCEENELEISEEDLSEVESYVDYYWNSYGYSTFYEPNGVGYETYKQYMTDSYYSGLYFEHLYGEGGEKEIAAETVKEKMVENFITANVLEASFTDLEEADITTTKETFNGYVEALKNGTRTFEEIYKEHNGTTDEETTSEDTEDAPKDKYASVLGADDTTYESDYFDDAKDMAVGEVKLVELDDEAGLVIIVKQDITADEYYLKNLDLSVRHLIADDEYDELIEKEAEKLGTEINKYAVNQFKVKKIEYPETTA